MDLRAWLCTGALLLVPEAQALAESPSARATALFREGRAAMERDDLAGACPKFEESAKLDPAPGTLLNLALCQEGLGKIGHALTNYRLVVALLPPSDERVPFATEHAEGLEPRVAHLSLVVGGGAPANATVLRDGEEVAEADLGVADPVDPGTHEVTLRIPGQKDVVVSVSLREGERRTLTLEPPAAAEPLGGGPSSTRGTVGLIVGGVGAASLSAGLITGALVLDKKATVDASCHGTSVCDTQEGVDAAAAGSTLSIVSTITFIAGVAGLGAGAYLILTSDDAGDDDAPSSGQSPRRSGPAVAALPLALPGGAGLSVRGTF